MGDTLKNNHSWIVGRLGNMLNTSVHAEGYEVVSRVQELLAEREFVKAQQELLDARIAARKQERVELVKDLTSFLAWADSNEAYSDESATARKCIAYFEKEGT
jgi:hypothetical protein